MKNRTCPWAVAACLVAVTPVASAAGLDGSKNIVCAVMDVVGCVDDKRCLQGEASTFELPRLIVVDTQAKVIRGTDESGHQETSAVKNMELDDKHLVLQGIEKGRGWGITINTETGNMHGSVVGDTLGMLVFGACTAL